MTDRANRTFGLIGGAALALMLAGPPGQAQDFTLAVGGNVKTKLSLSAADLRALAQTHVTASLTTGRGKLALDCTGPAVADVLAKAGPDFGPAHNALIAHTLLFTADDKYAVALSMGEIDPHFGKAVAIIATDCGGKPLARPRLVLPGDAEAARALSGLVSIEVK